MQTDYKLAYTLTSKRTGKDEELYKKIGNFVFAELYSKLRRPNSLIIKLKGVGYWFLRKSRMEGLLTMYPLNYEKNKEDFSSDLDFLKYENKKEIYKIFHDRLLDYEKYLNIKKEIRTKRNENQILLEPDKRED